ncbi:hypothetical protein CVT24_002590, partial [Panaeolus cyanescens]
IRNIALTALEHIFTSSSHAHHHTSNPNAKAIYALHLCQKYNIHQHLKAQYEALITSITPLTRATMLAGGIDETTTLEVLEMRERWFCGMTWGKYANGAGILEPRLSARTIVEDYFSASTSASDGEPAHVSITPDAEEVDPEGVCSVLEEEERLNEAVKHVKDLEEEILKEEIRKQKAIKEEERRAKLELEAAAAVDLDVQEGNVGVAVEGAAVGADADDLDDIQSVTSEMSVVPSPDVAAREADEGVESNPRMEKLTRVIGKLKRKLMKSWEKGVEQSSNDDDTDFIALDSLNLAKSTLKIEERLERLLHPSAKSLSFTIRRLPNLKKVHLVAQNTAIVKILE